MQRYVGNQTLIIVNNWFKVFERVCKTEQGWHPMKGKKETESGVKADNV